MSACSECHGWKVLAVLGWGLIGALFLGAFATYDLREAACRRLIEDKASIPAPSFRDVQTVCIAQVSP